MSKRQPSATPRKPVRRTREQWQQFLAELDLSGLSRAAFARRRGLSVRSLQWWAWHLRGEGAPRAVELVARQSPLAALSSFSAEIILGDLVLRLPDAAPSTIAAIVRELRASC